MAKKEFLKEMLISVTEGLTIFDYYSENVSTDLDYQVVLTEKGLNYLNKVFYEKIDSKSFPEFNRIIENEVLF